MRHVKKFLKFINENLDETSISSGETTGPGWAISWNDRIDLNKIYELLYRYLNDRRFPLEKKLDDNNLYLKDPMQVFRIFRDMTIKYNENLEKGQDEKQLQDQFKKEFEQMLDYHNRG